MDIGSLLLWAHVAATYTELRSTSAWWQRFGRFSGLYLCEAELPVGISGMPPSQGGPRRETAVTVGDAWGPGNARSLPKGPASVASRLVRDRGQRLL